MSQIKDLLRIYGLFFASLITLLGAILIGVGIFLPFEGAVVEAVISVIIGLLLCVVGLLIIWGILKKPSPPRYSQYGGYYPSPYYPPSQYPYAQPPGYPPPPPGYQYPPPPQYRGYQQRYPPQQYQYPPPPPGYYPPQQSQYYQQTQQQYSQYPSQPYSTSPGVQKEEETLDLPNIYILLSVFIISIFVGGISLFVGGALLILFPFCFIIAFSFPSLMWISYVYKKDVIEIEPRRAVLIALTFGFLCTIPAIILSTPFALFGFTVAAVVGAPVVEEFCKAYGLRFVKTEIGSELDGIIYGVTIGMGFAMIENFLYELSFLFSDVEPAALWTFGSLLRGLGSTVGHGLGTGLVGYFYAAYIKDRNREGAFRNLVLAYCGAMGLHALWNGTAVAVGENELGLILIIGLVVADVIILRTLVLRAREKVIAENQEMGYQEREQVPQVQYTPQPQPQSVTPREVTPPPPPPPPPQGAIENSIKCPNCQYDMIIQRGYGPVVTNCPICGTAVQIR